MSGSRREAGHVDRALAPARFIAALAWVFGSVALLLAAVGLYGVVSYAVGQRMPEMGVRLALGAWRADLTRLVVGDGLGLTLAGVIAGCAAAMALGRLVSAWLYGVTPSDPLTDAAIVALLVAVSTLASYLPARRAARADPSSVLHDS